jgi:hypothetical protein
VCRQGVQSKPASLSATPGHPGSQRQRVARDPSAPFPWHLPTGNCGARAPPCARARRDSIGSTVVNKNRSFKIKSYFEKRLDEIRSPFCSIAERVRNQSKLTMETKIDLACFSPILRPSTDGVWARPCGLQPGAAKVCKPSRRASAPLPGACVAGDPSAPFPWHLPAGNCGARRAPCARARRGLTIKPCCCASQIL